jgi:radical SAM-linked protein
VQYSQGFNPRPKLSLPLPRPVGVASDADLLVVDLSRETDAHDARDHLAAQMPEGIRLADARLQAGGRVPRPHQATYALAIHPDQTDAVASAVGRILEAASWPIERVNHEGKTVRGLDLRVMLVDADVEANEFRWTVRVTDGGSLRPAEVLAAVGMDPDACQHHVRRTRVQWQGDLEDIQPASQPLGG